MTEQHAASRRSAWPQWSRLTVVTWSVVVAALVGAAVAVPATLTAGFVAAIGSVLLVQSVLVLRTIRFVSRSAEETQPITLATWVTIARGAAVALLAGFAVTSPDGAAGWLPAALFLLAAGLDAIDGVMARLTDSVTALGAKLDVEMDGMAVLVGTVVAITDGALPAVFVLVGTARYLFVAGTWLRRRRNRDVGALPPNPVRRPLGALAMIAIWLALLPVPGAALSRPIATAVMVPFLANFCWDWLAVTGRLDGRW